jgi:peptidoglycan hydrolase-like amidase
MSSSLDSAADSLSIGAEPVLRVGVSPPLPVLRFFLAGRYALADVTVGPGWCRAEPGDQGVVVACEETSRLLPSPVILTPCRQAGTFVIPAVPVGAGFHWNHREDLTYPGSLELVAAGSRALVGVNRVGLEDYLESVISSEMNPCAPEPFLEAHAVVARSWVLAQLGPPRSVEEARPPGVDMWEWFDRRNHDLFDLCADDHCQRYHGQSRKLAAASQAVRRTRGTALYAKGAVVDARFSKCCGGVTEDFTTAWGGPPPTGLTSVLDASPLPPEWPHSLTVEAGAVPWIMGFPPAHCSITDAGILDRILLPMDRATEHFFRWREEFSQERLASLIEAKTGAGIGSVKGLKALRRGSSGRIEILEIQGVRGVLRIGKELAIRRLLSSSHLKSAAFVAMPGEMIGGIPRQITLTGAGWGHGVGMCQIGAGALAAGGADCAAILNHYFPEAELAAAY